MSLLSLFQGKKIIITGHTGFKGSWLTLWLKHLGANVSGLAIDIPTEPSHFIAARLSEEIDDHRIDIRDGVTLKNLVQEIQPDFVFHLAAQALVRPSYENPLETIATNAMGSANVLDALRTLDKPVVAVMITSDKAYDNVEWVWGYRETDRLGGNDPYSASKGMAELAIRTYVKSFFNTPDSNVRLGIARAGNVIGGGDWAADRIVPDCMKAWSRNEMVDIRSPEATRPWQHVLEPLSGYLALAAALAENPNKHGEAYNFGPPAHQNYSVRLLIDAMAKYWDHVRWNDVSQALVHLHEAGLLKLNCDKALFDLNWMPTLRFEETVRMTVQWYKAFYENDTDSMHEFSMAQIEKYTQLAQEREIEWAGA
jgi:CDP-glucose 4,6-dehydratase